jgi:hypothetical protein
MNPVRNPEIRTRLLPDGHAVLFSGQSDWAHTITPLAAVAWEFCDGQNSEDEIFSKVAEIAEAGDDAELRNIVKILIRDLKDSGLLVDASSGANPGA